MFIVVSFLPVAPPSVAVLYFLLSPSLTIAYVGEKHLRTLREIRQPAVHETTLRPLTL